MIYTGASLTGCGNTEGKLPLPGLWHNMEIANAHIVELKIIEIVTLQKPNFLTCPSHL